MFADQSDFEVRFEWGVQGLTAIAPGSTVIIIVDVLSFCTCVDIAVARGAAVLPSRWRDDSAVSFANEKGAMLANPNRRTYGYSLSPGSLAGIPPGTRLVLPSPNGATLSMLAAGLCTTVAACLRNASAVARFARQQGGPVSVIACGERWSDGSLRPAWEDMIGAGAVIAGLAGTRSPEASAAADAFHRATPMLQMEMRACASGRELIERGFGSDVELAAAHGASICVPLFVEDAFVKA